MSKLIVALITGALFGAGLTLAGMVNPLKVLNFLDIAGQWDPSLALVMGGGLVVSLITARRVLVRPKPLLTDHFSLPTATRIDRKLVIGSLLFGLGWGLAGYCPGPAVAALSFGSMEPWLFVSAMLVGAAAYKYLDPKLFPDRPANRLKSS